MRTFQVSTSMGPSMQSSECLQPRIWRIRRRAFSLQSRSSSSSQTRNLQTYLRCPTLRAKTRMARSRGTSSTDHWAIGWKGSRTIRRSASGQPWRRRCFKRILHPTLLRLSSRPSMTPVIILTRKWSIRRKTQGSMRLSAWSMRARRTWLTTTLNHGTIESRTSGTPPSKTTLKSRSLMSMHGPPLNRLAVRESRLLNSCSRASFTLVKLAIKDSSSSTRGSNMTLNIGPKRGGLPISGRQETEKPHLKGSIIGTIQAKRKLRRPTWLAWHLEPDALSSGCSSEQSSAATVSAYT